MTACLQCFWIFSQIGFASQWNLMSSFGKVSQPFCTDLLWASLWYFHFSKFGTRFPDSSYSRPTNTCVWQFKGLKYKKPENQVPYISYFEKQLKNAHTYSVQNGCDTFPNELVWFHSEAKPIWQTNQKQCKHAVIC